MEPYAEVMMAPILPSFSTLLAFDAAARHGTFTHAASELNVSQPAISRRVAALETDLGMPVFSRASRPLRLTPVGQRLFDVLRSGLSRLEAEVMDIRSQHDGAKITIAAAPGFLSFWLVPRLAELEASFPEYKFSLMTGDQIGEEPHADIHVRFGIGNWPGVTSSRILGEKVFAVCSPLYLRDRPRPIELAILKQERLLQLADGLGRWHDWRTWLEAAGAPAVARLNTIDFDSYALLISAALAGQGIALCWSGLLDQHIETGALLRVSSEVVRSDRGYYATSRKGTDPNSATSRLMRWLEQSEPAE